MGCGTVGVRVLGTVALERDGHPYELAGARQQALLLRLLLAGAAGVSPWQLRQDVWEDRHKSDAALRVAVSRLRAVLADAGAPGALVHRGDGYRLDRTLFDVDADRFARELAHAQAIAQDDPAGAVESVTQALLLWHGPPFGNLGDEQFLRAEADRLSGLRADAEDLRFASLLAIGSEGLVPDLEAAVADAPLRERRTGLLMLALYRSGRQAEALRVYRRLETVLREDLGLLPGAELRQLEHQILQHDPALRAPGRESATGGQLAHASAVHAALGKARAAKALARAGATDEADRVAASAVKAARDLDDTVLAECLVTAAQAWAMAGRPGDADGALGEAVVLARRLANGSVLAAAALARFGFGLADRDDLLAALVEPLELLPPGAPVRVDLLCAAMHQVALESGSAAAEHLLAQAEATVAALGDARSRAVALTGRAILAGVRNADAAVVRAMANEALESAEVSGDPTLVVAALHAVFRSSLEDGDIATLRAATARLAEVAVPSLFPFAVVRVGLLDISARLAVGDLEGLEARVADLESTGAALGVRSVAGTTTMQRALLALERGQFGMLATLASAAATGSPGWRSVAALALAEADRLAEAVEHASAVLDPHERLAGAEGLTPDERMVASMLAGEAAVIAGDPRLAGLAAADLEHLQGRFAVFAHATITLGPVDRVLGLLALACGRPDAAVDAFRAAVALSMQIPLWRARSEVALATALARRGGPGDAEEAARLLAAVRSAAVADPARGGSAWLAAQLGRAAHQVTPAGPGPPRGRSGPGAR